MGDEVGLYLVFGLFDVCDDCVVMQSVFDVGVIVCLLISYYSNFDIVWQGLLFGYVCVVYEGIWFVFDMFVDIIE